MICIYYIKAILIFFSLVFLGWDIVKSIHTGLITLTPIGEQWFLIEKDSLLFSQNFVQRYISEYLWDNLIQNLLLMPGIFFILFLWLAIYLFSKKYV